MYLLGRMVGDTSSALEVGHLLLGDGEVAELVHVRLVGGALRHVELVRQRLHAQVLGVAANFTF